MLVKMLASLIALILIFGVIIFAAAGTLDDWQAWLFLACYFVVSLVISLWLMRNDPALLERRRRGGPFAEGERSQRIIMSITSLGFVALLVVPGLDRRFGASAMPAWIALGGDLLLLASWLGIPISLGSRWGALLLVALALAWRLVDEERVLVRDLNGYADYRRRSVAG